MGNDESKSRLDEDQDTRPLNELELPIHLG